MANKKVSDLPAMTSAELDGGDLLLITDVTDDTSKKLTYTELLEKLNDTYLQIIDATATYLKITSTDEQIVTAQSAGIGTMLTIGPDHYELAQINPDNSEVANSARADDSNTTNDIYAQNAAGDYVDVATRFSGGYPIIETDIGVAVGSGNANHRLKVENDIGESIQRFATTHTSKGYSGAGTTELFYGFTSHSFTGTAPSGTVGIDSTKSGTFFYIKNDTVSPITFGAISGETFNGSATTQLTAGQMGLFLLINSTKKFGVFKA